MNIFRKLFPKKNKETPIAELSPKERQKIIDDFHRLYFHTRSVERVKDYWLGTRIIKYPGDLMIFQEILHELRPDWIVETGSHAGGSARFFSSICDLIGHGKVISIDMKSPEGIEHDRLTFIEGDSTAPQTVEKVRKMVEGSEKVLVTLDSNHTAGHVLKELEQYAPMVTVGSFLIVEDTKLNGHPVYTRWEPDKGPGPMEALDEFLLRNRDFEMDRSYEKYLLTSQPRGYLRKIRQTS